MAALGRQGGGRAVRERLVHLSLVLTTLTSIAVTGAIVFALVRESITFFGRIPIGDFLTGTTWTPLFAEPSYGVLPLVGGTLLITAIALAVAIPMGLLAAAWLSEYASSRAREVVKPALEMLVGVPTIVFGYFALTFFTPQVLKGLLGLDVGVFNALAAGVIMGVAIMPVVASIADDALRAVPHALREGAYALGSPRRTVLLRILFPAALSGVAAAIILATAKAIGETMIVTVAAGGLASLGANPLEPYATMTSFIAQTGQGDVAVGSTAYEAIFAVGALLFAITFMLNLGLVWAARRFGERYE